jgi:serine-type D-Ala-D-Ala carboxypeptidase/endopeptidase (penicillin-binding protein 4)
VLGASVKAAFGILVAIGAIAAGSAGAETSSAPGPLPNPDRPGATPLWRSGQATAASISRGELCRRLRSHLVRGGRRTGLFVLEAESGTVVCRKASRTRRSLASNMKLFTTAAALARFEPDQRIPTRLWRTGRLERGVLHGSLWLVGGGDPALGSPAFYNTYYGGLGTNLYALVGAVRRAGIRRVTGRLFADDTLFDRLRGVADSGYATSPYIGPLSALSFNAGYAGPTPRRFSSNPARLAARKLAQALNRGGVRIRKGVALRKLPDTPGRDQVAFTLSPRIALLVNLTNVYSNNFFAEMLLKRLGAKFGGRGSTRAGASVVERFARRNGSGVHAVDGSGLTSTNRASPAEVGRLLQAMRENYAGGRFVGSLAVAGREGTLAERMRGGPAEGRCRAKTGTIYGVSALSGYCFNRSGKVMAFSILMNGVGDVYRARLAQDRMAALISRY